MGDEAKSHAPSWVSLHSLGKGEERRRIDREGRGRKALCEDRSFLL